MTATPTIRNRPVPEPIRVPPPKEWESVFSDDELVKALANHDRLYTERGAAHQRVLEAERGLQDAALADRDDLAAAIHAGRPAPKSDAHGVKAATALGEAQRHSEATRQAFAAATRDVERVIAERRTAVLSDLESRITAAQADATKAIDSLASTLAILSSLRRGRQYIETDGRRANWVHMAGSWADVDATLRALVAEP